MKHGGQNFGKRPKITFFIDAFPYIDEDHNFETCSEYLMTILKWNNDSYNPFPVLILLLFNVCQKYSRARSVSDGS